MICKLCNNPIVMHMEARYTIADSEDGEFGEHYKCHEEFVSKIKTDGDRLATKVSEVKTTLARLKNSMLVLGWLLVTSPSNGGNVVAWYETEEDCTKASEYYAYSECGPDRHEFAPGGSLHQ